METIKENTGKKIEKKEQNSKSYTVTRDTMIEEEEEKKHEFAS